MLKQFFLPISALEITVCSFFDTCASFLLLKCNYQFRCYWQIVIYNLLCIALRLTNWIFDVSIYAYMQRPMLYQNKKLCHSQFSVLVNGSGCAPLVPGSNTVTGNLSEWDLLSLYDFNLIVTRCYINVRRQPGAKLAKLHYYTNCKKLKQLKNKRNNDCHIFFLIITDDWYRIHP